MKFRFGGRLKRLDVLAVFMVGLTFVSGCLQKAPSELLDFGWDEDLKLDSPGHTPPGGVGQPKGFCRNHKPEECFTLIIRVPTAEVISDVGLSAMALASATPNFNVRSLEACQTAWQQFQADFGGARFRPVRANFAKKIKEFRCIIVPFNHEYVDEDSYIPKGQLALSVRLTKFMVTATDSSLDLNIVKFSKSSVNLNAEFRNVFIHGRPQTQSEVIQWPLNSQDWQPVREFNLHPAGLKLNFSKDFSWQILPEKAISLFNGQDNGSNLNFNSSYVPSWTPTTMDPYALNGSENGSPVDSGINNGAGNSLINNGAGNSFNNTTKSFLNIAKDLITKSIANRSPLEASTLLLGVGFNAIKDICVNSEAQCRFTNTSTDVSKQYSDFSDGVKAIAPTAETNEFFRLALISTFKGAMNEFFETVPPEQIYTRFGP